MRYRILFIVFLVWMLAPWASALHMTDAMGQMSVKQAPEARKIQLKLPIRQEAFHWTFMKKDEVLAGKLVLTIDRNGEKQHITIFENGNFADGWMTEQFSEGFQESMVKPGEVYFLFKSDIRYLTAPGDKVELTLTVKSDLAGIGPLFTGVLPKGEYKAKGTYSMLVDEYQVSPQMKDVPKETLDKIREQMNNRAFLENWQDQWDVNVTSDCGWVPPERTGKIKQMLKQLEEEEGGQKPPEVSPFVMKQ